MDYSLRHPFTALTEIGIEQDHNDQQNHGPDAWIPGTPDPRFESLQVAPGENKVPDLFQWPACGPVFLRSRQLIIVPSKSLL